MKPLLKLLIPKWRYMLAAILLDALTVLSNIGLLAAAALLISKAALHPPVLALMTLIVGVRFFGISRAVFRYLERYVSHNVTFQLLKEIRVWFYSHLEPLAPAVTGRYHSGQLFSRIVTDVETLKDFYLRVLSPPLTALLVLTVVFIFLAWFELKLALIVLLFFLLSGIALPLAVKFAGRDVGRRTVEVKSALNTHLVDCIKGAAEITVFGQVDKYQAKSAALSQQLIALQNRTALFSGLSNALSGFAANVTLWLVLLVSIPLVSTGKIEGVCLAMLPLAAFGSFEAVLPLPMMFQYLEKSLASIRRLFKIIAAKPPIKEPTHSVDKPHSFSLQIKNLCFRYSDDDRWALENINLTLPAGKKIAVVGPSGSGKSTLINLLLRFWDYQHGSVCLGGNELKLYSPDNLRRYFAVVSQHTHLFNATVWENLLLARPEANPEEVYQAAKDAQIDDFIQSLPQGYDTYIGEGGFKLSGGQRRRLAIARALLKNAPILILDEPTAGLDAVTEKNILKTLEQIMQDKTTLVITHRLTGLENMDQILVLKNGQTAEQGREEELLKRKGLYYHMQQLQRQVLSSD